MNIWGQKGKEKNLIGNTKKSFPFTILAKKRNAATRFLIFCRIYWKTTKTSETELIENVICAIFYLFTDHLYP